MKTAADKDRHNWLARQVIGVLCALIRIYQLTLSPYIGGQCRFYPTCSHYAAEAIRSHGPLTGSWLAMRRLSKCHPFNQGGVDPVPDRHCQH